MSSIEGTRHESDEAQLVERVQQGDRLAFERLVDRYADRAYRVAYQYLRDMGDAEDLVQDAFIRALERIDRLRPGSPFGPWFYRLLVNTAINRRRYLARRRMTPVPRDVASGDDPAAAPERRELRQQLSEALRALPSALESVVVLHELEGFTHAEIAEMLGIPEGTSRSHLSRARGILRDKLSEYRRQS